MRDLHEIQEANRRREEREKASDFDENAEPTQPSDEQNYDVGLDLAQEYYREQNSVFPAEVDE